MNDSLHARNDYGSSSRRDAMWKPYNASRCYGARYSGGVAAQCRADDRCRRLHRPNDSALIFNDMR
jgi:hypothetical protein